MTGDLLRRPAVVAQVNPADKERAGEELSRENEVAALLRRTSCGAARSSRRSRPPTQ
ncbi:hypothetical protein [Streptomyces sp. NPDC040750]|uniref:DUF6192 family protein n=1 Tax=Streptomyces sp. NPDC040750 TaxID=3154491 RepID=UPI0033EB2288